MANMSWPPTRRLVPATIVALLLGAAYAAAAGAAGQGPAGDPPASVDIPQPSIGDAGEYRLQFLGQWREVTAPPLRFEWQDGPPIAGRTGQVVETDKVLVQQPAFRLESPERVIPIWSVDNRTLLFPQGSADLEAEISRWDESSTVVDPGVLGVLGSSRLAAMNGTWLDFRHGDACLLANPFQGTTLAAAQPRPFPASCVLPPGFVVKPSTSLSAMPEMLRGAWTLRLHQAANGTDGQPWQIDAWFADGVPYPVQLELRWPRFTWGFMAKGENPTPTFVEVGPFSVRLSLAAYSSGATPRGAPQAIEAIPLGHKERLPWGPDDTGVPHPFPLSQAYLRARDEPTFPGLRDFLAKHPTAVVTEAKSSAGDIDGAKGWTWRLVVQDAESGFALSASKQVRGQLEQVDDDLANAAARYEFSGYVRPRVEYPIDSTNAPSTMPTVAALAQRWQAHAASTDMPNGWGFRMDCGFPPDCSEVQVTFDIGVSNAKIWSAALDPSGPGFSQGVEATSSVLRVSNDTAQVFFTSTGRIEDSTAIAAVPVGSSPDPLRAAQPRTATRFVLNGGVVASAGFVAFAAGLLYWLWPALKGGLLGLFSRLREPELLHSPQRRRIMDLVEAQPGIHFKELLRRSGLPNGSLVHHVGQLQKAGLLVAKPANGYTCYFPRGPVDAGRAAFLKADGARQVLAAVQASPGLSGLEVAHLTGLQPSTVNYHARRLADAGLLSTVRDGRSVRLHPRMTKA